MEEKGREIRQAACRCYILILQTVGKGCQLWTALPVRSDTLNGQSTKPWHGDKTGPRKITAGRGRMLGPT